jgi:hypothetical protein
MKISLRYKHTTKIFPGVTSPGQKTPPATVNVIYEVLDKVNNQPLICRGGQANPTNHFYEPSDEEADLIFHLQKLAETRYMIRSRPLPKSQGQVCFEAVKILTFERELGEIEWEPATRSFEAAISENVALELTS